MLKTQTDTPLVNRLPSDYRYMTAYEAEMFMADAVNYPDVIDVLSFDPHGVDWGTDLAVPKALPIPCVREFGEHDDCTGNDECPAMETLDMMSGGDYSDYLAWEREGYNRELEEASLGRPLFPNEY